MAVLNQNGRGTTGAVPTASLVGGGMAERTIALVLKTSGPQGPGGSNPPPSAPTAGFGYVRRVPPFPWETKQW